MEASSNPSTSTDQAEDKTAAILAYITLIGFIIAIVMQSSNKTKIGAYHLRQALGMICSGFAIAISIFIIAFIPFVNFLLVILAPVLWIGMLVLIIMGIVNAANGQMKPVPIIGKLFEKWFGKAFE